MSNQPLPQLIAEIIEHHKDLLWNANVKNATNLDEFEKWSTVMAQQHAVITLKYLFTEEEFAQLQDESVNPAAADLD